MQGSLDGMQRRRGAGSDLGRHVGHLIKHPGNRNPQRNIILVLNELQCETCCLNLGETGFETMTAFSNRLTTPEDRSIRFDPFGKWEAEWSIHERDLKSYETYKQDVSADKQLAAKFKKTYDLFVDKYRSNFETSEASQYAASTFGGYLRLFLEDHSNIDSALDATLKQLMQQRVSERTTPGVD